jgi:hypothetical protein
MAASSVSVGQTVAAYQFFLPPLREVRQADPTDSTMRGDVFLGQVAAGALSIGVGVSFSLLTGSYIPVWVAGFTALIIAGMYHKALMTGDNNAT